MQTATPWTNPSLAIAAIKKLLASELSFQYAGWRIEGNTYDKSQLGAVVGIAGLWPHPADLTLTEGKVTSWKFKPPTGYMFSSGTTRLCRQKLRLRRWSISIVRKCEKLIDLSCPLSFGAIVVYPDLLEPSVVMMVGDTHSRIGDWIYKIIPTALANNVSVLVVAGDFETTDYGGRDFPAYRDFVSLLSKQLAIHDMTVVFADGNHDRHSFLRGLMREQHINDHDAFVRVRDNIWYSPRGFTWIWSGKRFMSFGGAYSITDDRNGQIARGVYEWDEIISQADAGRALSRLRPNRGRADVLVTHDCPMEVPLAELHEGVRPWTRGDSPETDLNRMFVSEVFATGGFDLCFHGHYHLAYQYDLEMPVADRSQRVIGLGANAEAGSLHRLDLSGERVEHEVLIIVTDE